MDGSCSMRDFGEFEYGIGNINYLISSSSGEGAEDGIIERIEKLILKSLQKEEYGRMNETVGQDYGSLL
ncbi:MAG: hypothetical protein LBE35_03185 [Clostridiales bacterium]|jgi:hypothetical protein|nr:hypothetical protein [Clostridiales bacterium]